MLVLLRACSYGDEPARLPGWIFLPRSHLIPNSNTKLDFCSYELAGWPAKRDLTCAVSGLARLHMNRPLCTGEISVGGMKIFSYEHSIPATEMKMSLLLMRCLSKQWARVSFLTRVPFLSRQAGWNFSI